MWMRERLWCATGGADLTRQLFRLGVFLGALTLLIIALGCEGIAPAATATPTPTPTVTPTPTATPTPMQTPSPTFEPTATEPPAIQTVDRELVDELMALVPQELDSAVFTDIRFLLLVPDLKGVLDRQVASFGIAAIPIQEGVEKEQVDYMVTAKGESGLLGVLRGPLDVEEVIKSLEKLGPDIQNESHGAFGIWNVEVDLVDRQR